MSSIEEDAEAEELEPRARDGEPSAIINERVKLSATYLNNLGVSLFAVGFLAPMVSILSDPAKTIDLKLVIASLVCIIFSAVLHLLGRAFLGRMSA